MTYRQIRPPKIIQPPRRQVVAKSHTGKTKAERHQALTPMPVKAKP